MRDIEWGDASYVRLYTYDHPSWMDLSWQAKGVYTQLRRKADRAGLLPMSKKGLRSLAGHMGHSGQADEILPFLQELVDEGWLEVHGDVAVVPQFIESESAHATNAQRSRKSREKRRDLARVQHTATHDDTSTPRSATHCNETLHHVAPNVSPSVLPSVSSRNVYQHAGEHVERHTTPPITISLSDHIHSPPSPPKGSDGGGRGGEHHDPGEDPNLADIRRKLASMQPPLRHLAELRAEERLYAPVMAGAVTVADVLAAIDDAALKLGPELGNVLREDKPGMTAVEKFVAGCVKRVRNERRAASMPASKATPPPASEPSPEVHAALLAFVNAYTSGGYDKFFAASDDHRNIAEALAETAKHTTGTKDATDVLVDAAKAYLADDFYASQGHSLKRFVAVLKSEPTRLLGKRRTQQTREEANAEWRRQQILRDMQEPEEFDPATRHAPSPEELQQILARMDRVTA